MDVKVEDEGEFSFPEGSKVSSLIEELGYHQDSVIVLSDGEPLPLDEELENGMDLKLISVVSGG